MKEKIKVSDVENQTSDEKPEKVDQSEFSSPLINGEFEEDIHVLQCVNNGGTDQKEQSLKSISASDPNNPMPSLFILHPSNEATTEPLHAANGNPLSGRIRTESQFVSTIGSDVSQSDTTHLPCMPERYCFPTGFGGNFAENWQQRFRGHPFSFPRDNDAVSQAQQLLNFRGAGQFGISEKKPKLEDVKDLVRGSREPQAQELTSPGELIQETLEVNGKRKRQGEDEPRKSAQQRKMEHLDKEKERRLRQSKCYDILRDLVPSCEMKTDKANVLQETVAYLNYIKEILGSRMVVIDKGFREDEKRKKGSLK